MNGVNPTASLPVLGTAPPTAGRTTEKEDFLRLLVAQLRHQDPLNPVEGSNFAAQLAQFSSLEELRNIGGQLDGSIETNMLLARAINNTQATTLIGRTVRAVEDRVTYDGFEATPVRFNLSGAASSVTVEIVTENGQVLRRLTGVNLPEGDGSLEWDGRNGSGNPVPPGTYRVKVSAKPLAGGAVTALPIVIGRVQAVRFEDGNPVLVIDGRSIPFGAVLEVIESDAGPEGAPGLFGRFLRFAEGN
ncbi:MAG: flagellar hook capping protein [Calditrichaeota bacterium]|nr:flagellar hook capping protein [Calditrichota bacterium]